MAQVVEHLLEGGQRRGDVEIVNIAHVADAEDLALRRAAAAVDRDVVRGREPLNDPAGVQPLRNLHRGERGARRSLGEELETERLDAGPRRAGEPVVTAQNVRE